MTFFLDFDRTIFDTYASYPYLSQKLVDMPEFKKLFDEVMLGEKRFDYTNPLRGHVSKQLEELFQSGQLVLEEGEYAPFVYDDARDFLRIHGSQSVIVTANRDCPMYQEARLRASGVSAMVKEVRNIPLASGNTKGDEVHRAIQVYEGPYVFIDDHDAQLDAVQRTCPEVSVYEMRRDGGPASGAHPIITNFSELPL